MTTYTVNQTYLDKANRHHPSDQFARWLTPQSGPSIANAGGIRAQRIATGPHAGELAVVYLMTAHVRTVSANPWTDHVDISTGEIQYWGDARSGATRAFRGNRVLQEVEKLPAAERPPILHFVRVKPGELRFSGLCVLEKLEERVYRESTGSSVPNLMARLMILNTREISAAWIRRRVEIGPEADNDDECPIAWRDARSGRPVRIVHSLPAETAPVKLDASAGDSEATEMPFDWTERFEVLLQEIEQSGFSYQPWQVATYLTALRTKPFVILAGVSGTGKSKLPAIVAKFTGMADTKRIAVRPDWTDSSEVLGYQDLNGRFRPGVILREFHAAAVDNSRFHTCIIDEMNLAPVENYFAEILSAMEDTNRSHDGLQWSSPLLPFSCHNTEMPWAATRIPPNIALVGTVNVDETTHQFSRKVLDRAFTIELAEIDLEMLPPRRSVNAPADITPKSLWPISFWLATHRRLSDLDATVPETRAILDRVNNVLSQLNTALNRTQMQVGYRVRDEIAIFVYHSQLLFAGFRTHSGTIIDALDAALLMKILPRIVGSSHGIRRLLTDLLGIAQTGRLPNGELSAGWIGESAEQIVDAAGTDVLFPLFFARLMLMLRRLDSEGYTSFWI